MLAPLVHRLRDAVGSFTPHMHRNLRAATTPAPARFVGGRLTDLGRSKPALIAENVLRHQLIILQRSVKRPRCTR